MTLNTFTSGVDTNFSGKLNAVLADAYQGIGVNVLRQLEDRAITFNKQQLEGYGEVFVDNDGRLDSVDLDEAYLTYDSGSNTYNALLDAQPYVIIEADSLNEGAFSINDCFIDNFDDGKWVLRCTAGSLEVRRAQIYKTLFYGDNPPIVSDATNVTSLSTSVSRDVGKRAYYAFARADVNESFSGGSRTADATLDITFDSTTGNNDVSTWTKIQQTDNTGQGGSPTSFWEIPDGTKVTSLTQTTSTLDETGTDTTADEVDNPPDAQLFSSASRLNDNQSSDSTVDGFFLTESEVTFTSTINDSQSNSNGSTKTSDFTGDDNIPVFTATTEDFPKTLTLSLPLGTFASDISTSIAVPYLEAWNSNSTLEYKLKNNQGDDTGFLPCDASPTISSFTAFTSEPEQLVIRLQDTTPLSEPVSNPSFEDPLGTEWTYVETEDDTNKLSAGGRGTDFDGGETDGSHSVSIDIDSGANSGRAFYEQTGIDFTGVGAISFDTAVSNNTLGRVARIEIVDATGNVIQSRNQNFSGTSTVTLNLSGLSRADGDGLRIGVDQDATASAPSAVAYFDNVRSTISLASLKGIYVRAT